ncbi:AFG1-like ATPase [Xylariaceae sp. FL0255]|nr:AFG1-like ATPase [Xylariaceae sp. FL0255]
MKPPISSVTITDPLVKYQSLLATGLYCPDPAQHRLAIHLQKVYHRLKDYTPSTEYSMRLKAITSALDDAQKREHEHSRDSPQLAVQSHPIHRNPLFARFFARTQGTDTLALTRVLTSHEEAIHIDSPQGLFLSGEVGTGKSMLVDLLAEGLPTSRKRRWHFNTFMLYTLSQLERHRKMNMTRSNSQVGEDQVYSLLWMAKDMIEKSPILFLDEFQLPDRAASKILSNLFTAFFQLGGVLIASSNRMPDELEKATGYDYVAPKSRGLLSRTLGLSRNRGRGELFGSSSDFTSFLQVLKARCEFYQMEGGRDWRRRGTESSPSEPLTNFKQIGRPSQSETRDELREETSPSGATGLSDAVTRPKKYFLLANCDDSEWHSMIQEIHIATSSGNEDHWKAAKMTIYGRTITIPQQRDGVVRWDFDNLVSSFGPADYISMASTYHTFIIDNIPVLTIQKKNEARRLITLLDALYEARCKLIVRAAVGPDDLFFPEQKASGISSTTATTAPSISTSTPTSTTITTTSTAAFSSSSNSPTQDPEFPTHFQEDAIHSETIAESYQDQTSPFRPNISSYTDSPNTTYDPDSDFSLPFSTTFNPNPDPHQVGRVVDFSNTAAFTGEDERFAYKRAASRLWELCGERWHARSGPDWWVPLPVEARHWEGGEPARPRPWSSDSAGTATKTTVGDAAMGPAVELDEPAGLGRLRVEEWRKLADGESKGGS